MRRFLGATDDEFAELLTRARNGCVTFPDVALPRGSSPAVVRVGIEVDGEGGVTLFVDRGVRYSGLSSDVRSWLAAGGRRFVSAHAFRRWLESDLAPSLSEVTPMRSPATLTHLELVELPAPASERRVRLDPEELLARLQLGVRGQDVALSALAHHVSRHLARTEPRRPLTVLLMGPSGVGKTKTATLLAETLREIATEPKPPRFLRLDMNEFTESYRVSTLLGAAPGYVGYDSGAPLLDTLAANPRSVILFDEIEKAHRDLWLVLMNAMDAGEFGALARGRGGRGVSCREAIFLFTSNLQAGSIGTALAERHDRTFPEVIDAVAREHLLAAGLLPELVGRINLVLVYEPLSPRATAEVAAIAIATVAAEYGIDVAFIEPLVVSAVLHATKTAAFGARPYEYTADRLLGGAFAAAQEAGPGPYRVVGGECPSCVLDPNAMSKTTTAKE